MAALAAYLGVRGRTKSEPVWLVKSDDGMRPMNGQRFYKIIGGIARRAGVVGAHPHRFRVHFAVTFLNTYGNIAALKEVLGHSDLKTTEHYATFGITDTALALQGELDLAGMGLRRAS
jgi:site-specific recombinase XerD